MIVLAIVTLGGYLVYWYIVTTRTLNQRVTVARISPLFMAVCVLMTIANLAIAGVLGWGEGAGTPYHRLQEAESIVNTADLVLGLIWALRIRYSLNLMTDVQKPNRIWVSGLWTWLFHPFYLQLQINRILKEQGPGRGAA